MAESIVVQQGNEDTIGYWKVLPPFMWLLRDVLLKIPKKDGKEVSPTEYLKTTVLCVDDSKEQKSMGEDVHRALHHFFPSFRCETLPIPATSEEVMEQITTSQEQLNPLFSSGVDKLIDFLQENVKPKKVFDGDEGACNGPTLATLVQVVANKVNDPRSIPALDSTWKLVVSSRCKAVQDRLLEEYKTAIKACYDKASKEGPIDEYSDPDSKSSMSVMGIHEQNWKVIREKLCNELGPLLSSPVTEECTLQSVEEQLENQLVQYEEGIIPHTQLDANKVVGGAIFPILEKNRKKSLNFCKQIFTDLYNPIKKKALSGKDGYTPEDLATELEKAFQEYDKKSAGPERWRVRAKMERTIKENQEIFEKRLEELLRRAQLEREAKQMQESLRNLVDSRRQLDERFTEFAKQQNEAAEKRKLETETEVKKLKEKIKQHEEKEKEMHRKELERVGEEARRKAEEEYMKKMSDEKIKKLEEAVDRSKEEAAKQKNASEEELKEMRETLVKKEKENTKRKQEREREIEEFKRNMEQTLKQMEERKAKQLAEADGVIENMKQRLQQKQKEADEQQAKHEKELTEKENELEVQKEQNAQMEVEFQEKLFKLEEEKKQEKKWKEIAEEEAKNNMKRLDEVVENGNKREAQIKKQWEQSLTKSREEKESLSYRIDKLSQAITNFEKKPLVKLFRIKVVKK